MKAVEIKKDIYWVGALDPDLRIFDIVMYTPYGTTYNSYVVKGSEKTAIFETVKVKYFDQYIKRLESLNIDISKIDYIIVDHTEPDHAGSVEKILSIAKNAKVVGSPAAIKFLKAIANRDFEYITVGDGDTLSLGDKTLKFINAPFLHWPDSIYTYLEEEGILFTCDSFGSHYCSENIFNDQIENMNNYMDALRYYFDCIMGPFKPYVLQALRKIKDLKINYICTGHGPILRENPEKIMKLYKEWSTPSNTASDGKKVTIAYVSAYGYTQQLAEKIADGIKSKGNFAIESYDVTYSKFEEVLASIDRADGILFGSPTINGDALKPIWDLLTTMNPIVHGKKAAGAFGSYGWSGEAVKNLEDRLKQLRLKTINGLRVNFKPSDEEFLKAYNFGQEFASLLLGETTPQKTAPEPVVQQKSTNKKNKKWKCIVCGLIVEGPEPPEICPACGAGSDQFIEVVEEEITFKSEKIESYIIIGNGAAGLNAAQAIRKRNSVCSIEIISSEKYRTYYRPQLSDLLSSEIPEDKFYMVNKDYYEENNIKLTLETNIVEIKPEIKTVVLDDGTRKTYDKLILANGSSSFMPQISGIDKKGVYSLKDLDDALEIKEEMKNAKRAVVVGGGLLGLEAAWEIKKQGLEVTVVEYLPRLVPNQVNDGGSSIFNKLVSQSGVNIILGDTVKEILGDGEARGVKLSSGREVVAELVLFSVGIRSNKSLAERCGIPTNHGVLINDRMETGVKDIYACGDVAELNGIVYGNWPAALEMGTTAGSNAVGDNASFKGFVSSVVFNAMNVELFSAGNINNENAVQFEIKDSNKNIYKKLFFKDDKLVGGILLGDTSKAVQIVNGIEAGLSLTEMIRQNII